ncbi:Methyltransferase domain-containing protein [Thalassobacillus cyri]|uniref:Methyltransferase domain-containing protein n=1 Tax=Thalassobacillus cyri TaxID=571932 RepID=A0A1H4D8B3_9BACI|nr:class I SAM-dependent methyltransferase [Thalassobacillus cyri]SEA68512.1 Methyltransferase domain-containing protein [Thalassobacillus cyri]
MNEWTIAMQARKWMKKNESFLYSWHAYVGSELGLFDAFKEPVTVDEVASRTGFPEDLLESWVQVGVELKHLKKKDDKFRTSKKRCSALMSDYGSPGVAALLKEMMELHLPTLLAYPNIMRSKERASFDHEEYGGIVAETSALLEHFAIRKIKRKVREQKIETIVDLGCGHGGYLRKLADHFPDIQMIGVDINEKVIESARLQSKDYPNLTFEVGDFEEWEPKQGKVDMILLHNVFHYIHPDERSRLLEKINQNIGEGGVVSVITPLSGTEHGKAFSSAFNSFFVAHSNLYALPKQSDLDFIFSKGDFDIFDLDPIIKEGSWFTFWLTPKAEEKGKTDAEHAEIQEQQEVSAKSACSN